jgi:hypothetical protein
MVVTTRVWILALSAMLASLPLSRALADPAIKPAITGLISTGSMSNTMTKIARVRGVFGGIVIQARWKDFQPNVIDDALVGISGDNSKDNVTGYNEAAASLSGPNNRKIGVRLRIFAGCSSGASDAPDWAMGSDPGFPITVTAEYNNKPEACELGQFWNTNSNYAKAWRNFQRKLAAIYDSNPLIQEISVTSCTSFSAEPFFLNLKVPQYDAKNPAPDKLPPSPTDALQSAGYTDAAYEQCLTKAIDDYAPWQATRLEFSFNGFGGVAGQNDIAASERIMRRCRLALGLRCILSNHDLDATTPSSILPIYVFERKLGPNLTFQTLHEVPDDFEGTLRKGISLGAGSIEIWQEPMSGTFEDQPYSVLAKWATMFDPH